MNNEKITLNPEELSQISGGGGRHATSKRKCPKCSTAYYLNSDTLVRDENGYATDKYACPNCGFAY